MYRTVNALFAVVFAVAAGTAVGLYAAKTYEARQTKVATVAAEQSPMLSMAAGKKAARVVTDMALSAAEQI